LTPFHAVFTLFLQAFGEMDEFKLNLQVKSLHDTFFPWDQPYAIQAELRNLLSGRTKSANNIDVGSVKAGGKIQPSSCLMTGKFWVGGLTNEV